MGSPSIVTISCPIWDIENFKRWFNTYVDQMIDEEGSHESIFERIKKDGIEKYLVSSAKGDMLSFGMEPNYFNHDGCISALRKYLVYAYNHNSRNRALAPWYNVIILHQYEQAEDMSITEISWSEYHQHIIIQQQNINLRFQELGKE